MATKVYGASETASNGGMRLRNGKKFNSFLKDNTGVTGAQRYSMKIKEDSTDTDRHSSVSAWNDWLSLAFRSSWEPWVKTSDSMPPDGAMILDSVWYVPRWGCDTLQHMMAVLRAYGPSTPSSPSRVG
jgi:hypothetical protein